MGPVSRGVGEWAPTEWDEVESEEQVERLAAGVSANSGWQAASEALASRHAARRLAAELLARARVCPAVVSHSWYVGELELLGVIATPSHCP